MCKEESPLVSAGKLQLSLSWTYTCASCHACPSGRESHVRLTIVAVNWRIYTNMKSLPKTGCIACKLWGGISRLKSKKLFYKWIIWDEIIIVFLRYWTFYANSITKLLQFILLLSYERKILSHSMTWYTIPIQEILFKPTAKRKTTFLKPSPDYPSACLLAFTRMCATTVPKLLRTIYPPDPLGHTEHKADIQCIIVTAEIL